MWKTDFDKLSNQLHRLVDSFKKDEEREIEKTEGLTESLTKLK